MAINFTRHIFATVSGEKSVSKTLFWNGGGGGWGQQKIPQTSAFNASKKSHELKNQTEEKGGFTDDEKLYYYLKDISLE